MTYTKPNIVVVGEATRVIQGGKDDSAQDDGLTPARHFLPIPPAYELDE